MSSHRNALQSHTAQNRPTKVFLSPVTCTFLITVFNNKYVSPQHTHREGLHQNIHLPDKYVKYTYEQKHKGIFIPTCEIHSILSISHTHSLKHTQLNIHLSLQWHLQTHHSVIG